MLPKLPAKAIERFWSKVDRRGPDECWLWLGCKDKDGYGDRVSVDGNRYRASKLALLIAGEPIDQPLVLHRCDNPPCVNPAHLYSGNQVQNMRDRKARGKYAREYLSHLKGESAPGAKLSNLQAAAATCLRQNGFTVQQIAVIFGISESQMSRVTRGLTQHAT